MVSKMQKPHYGYLNDIKKTTTPNPTPVIPIWTGTLKWSNVNKDLYFCFVGVLS